MFTSHINRSYTNSYQVVTYQPGFTGVVNCGTAQGGPGYEITSASITANSPVTYGITTTIISPPFSAHTTTNYWLHTYLSQYPAGDRAIRVLRSSGASYFNVEGFEEEQISAETAILSSYCVSGFGGDSGLKNYTNTTTQGFTAVASTRNSNYYKTTQKTNYYTTIPSIISGECSSVWTQLDGSGTRRNITDNFTTRQQTLGLQIGQPDQYGEVSYYYAQGDSVMFTGTPSSTTNDNLYKFSDVYNTLSATRLTSTLNTNRVFANVKTKEFDEFFGDSTFFLLRPVNVSGWTDDTASISGSYWAGFGEGFSVNQAVYKTLTTSSQGDTWGSSNIFKTSMLGNLIDDDGPRVIHTGCQSWTQNGTTAWSTSEGSPASSTETTVMATYSSTVSTSTAVDQPTTSTRSDKFATYTIGLDSQVNYTNATTTESPAIYYGNAPVIGPDHTFGSFARQNNYTSNQTLYLSTGVFMTISQGDGASPTTETSRITATNETMLLTQEFFNLTISQTNSFYTKEIQQGIAYNIELEDAYGYEFTDFHVDPVTQHVTNTNLEE